MEKNRKNLHDYSLLLVFLAVLDLFSFFASVIGNMIKGTIDEQLATVEPDLVGAVKVALVAIVILMAALTFSSAFVGFKGLKVARIPNADKGYIVVAKVFLVLSIIAAVSFFAGFFDSKVDVAETIINFANIVVDICAYILFIKAANAVRADFLAGKE